MTRTEASGTRWILTRSPHTDDVAAVLAELAAVYDEADGSLREKLDALADDGMVHRLEDASRAGSLARYRNR